eukprot:NODE_2090_length_655_cov_99.878788_g2040_i0.p1 GENE.NODE_2090_length_655_cov_99.878788_g2040_i0~~NODE_2090_length_655_cov_99.878788_g2040_i0.p1  ORF type:complete len:152 (+),score=11.99 NODE_2090_length_655_cov_99.878788_g2040_i0:79-534(+)
MGLLEDFKNTGKDLLPLTWGMVAALAWNTAIQRTFDWMFQGKEKGGMWPIQMLFCILLTVVLIVLMVFVLRAKSSGACFKFDKKVVNAFAAMIVLAFALVDATAWNGFATRMFCLSSKDPKCSDAWGLLLLYAVLITITAIIVVTLMSKFG